MTNSIKTLKMVHIKNMNRNREFSLVVQWLGLCPVVAEGLGSIPGQGTKRPQAVLLLLSRFSRVRLCATP